MKTLAAIALSAVVFLPAAGQQTKILTADKHNEYGLVYNLPKTALAVDVTAERTVRKAGPYFQYAKKSIGTDEVVLEDSESWTITSVKVTPYGVADPQARFLMQLKPGATSFIGVDADGMLLSINRNPEGQGALPAVPEPREEGEKIALNEYLQYVDQDFISSQSMAKQAQMLAESLMEIRDAKISLTRGTAETMPTDGKQLELMLNSLGRQEAAVAAAFAGTTEKETVTRRFTYIPAGDAHETLFRMSDFAGFVDADDYSGEPVWINVEVTNRAALPLDAKGETKKVPKDAVAYKVPGAASVSVTFKGKTLFSQEMEMGQFGVVFGIAPLLFSDRKTPSYAVFDPVTGGLKEIGELKEGSE